MKNNILKIYKNENFMIKVIYFFRIQNRKLFLFQHVARGAGDMLTRFFVNSK